MGGWVFESGDSTLSQNGIRMCFVFLVFVSEPDPACTQHFQESSCSVDAVVVVVMLLDVGVVWLFANFSFPLRPMLQHRPYI